MMTNSEVCTMAIRHAKNTSTNWIISLLNKTVGKCYIPDMNDEELEKVVQAINDDIDYRIKWAAIRQQRINNEKEIREWNAAIDAKKKAKKS